jgi:hypothetical protein
VTRHNGVGYPRWTGGYGSYSTVYSGTLLLPLNSIVSQLGAAAPSVGFGRRPFFWSRLRTGRRSCATARGLSKRQVPVSYSARVVHPRFGFSCLRSSHCRHRGARTMAGRCQGYHLFRDEDGESRRSVEVFWEHNGWFWRPRFKGRPAEGEAVGPFTTSTQAYKSAKSSGQRSPIAR